MVNATGIRAGGNDSWDRFTRLAQEARMRNQGISAEKTIVLNVKATVKNEINMTDAIQNASPARSTSFTTGSPNVGAKILGGLFDTYV